MMFIHTWCLRSAFPVTWRTLLLKVLTLTRPVIQKGVGSMEHCQSADNKQLPFTSIVLANFLSQNRHRRETYLYSACLSRSCFYVVLVCVSYSVALVVQACGPFFHLRSPCCFVTRGVSLHPGVGPGTEAAAGFLFLFFLSFYLFFFLFLPFLFFFLFLFSLVFFL